MGWLWTLLAFLNNLWSVYKEWQTRRTAEKLAKALEKQLAREAAVDQSKKAETDEDIFKNQTDITNNLPH